ncbi:MAG: glutamyl-tRNA amidotransferase, partial [Treponema sp.]|nr:glutamyl-tRNA amidotransferase [Treponema sp.]
MYQSFVYVEVRIQLPAVESVFYTNDKNHKICINEQVLQQVYILAKALECKISTISDVEHITNLVSKQESGKDLTGYSVKIAEGGKLNLLFHSHQKTIHIEEVRIEEDLGRLTHANGTTRMDYSCAGNPSIRIRT